MPKGHSTVGAQHALARRMGARPRGIRITVTGSGVSPIASIYVAGLTLGTLTQSQKDAFTIAFANTLNVSPNLLTLTFDQGSLIIGISINSSQISTPADDAFVTNAQSVLSRISNSDITNTIVNSGTGNVIVGIPNIDPTKNVVNVDPAVQSASLSKYTAYNITQRVVADNVRNCIYTLINSMIVRINSNGNIDCICALQETQLHSMFITQDKAWIILPTYNLIGDSGIPNPNYLGPHSDVIYVISIASGVVYINNLSIHFSYPYFGFNKDTNNIYYYSGETATFGERCVAQIDFKTRTITSSIVQMPVTSAGESITASSVFTDLNTEFLYTATKIIRRNLTNNAIREIDGFNYISDVCFDSVNNRILILDRGTSQVKSMELTTGNYQITIIAGVASASLNQLNTKLNSTYALSKFVDPSNLALFNNTILVLDRTGTRVLSSGYVNDMFVLGTSTDTVTLSSAGGGPSVTFKISTASYNTLTVQEINTLKYKFLELYPNIDPNGVTFDLTNGSIIVKIKYNDSMIINLFRQKELACLSNFRSVFSDTPKILDNFKNAVISANVESNFDFSLRYGDAVVIASGFTTYGVAVDSAGNIYVGDTTNNQVKKITPAGVVTVIASGFRPYGLAVDSVGNVYVVNASNFHIKKITPAGVVTVIATGVYSYGLAVDSVGNVYASDTNNQVKKITPAGVVTVIASGVQYVHDLAVDSADNIYVSDYSNQQVKKITPSGIVTVLVGGFTPYGLDVDSADNIYVSDYSNQQVKKITPSGLVTVIASGFYPIWLDVDSSGNVYVTDSTNNQIKKFALGPYINDDDVSVDIDDRIVKKCKEFLTPLSPLFMCSDMNGNTYTTDLKDSILKLNINDGTTTILATLPPTITTHTLRALSFLGASSDGKYLTIRDVYNTESFNNYFYRIEIATGIYQKVVMFTSASNTSTIYNKFTDCIFFRENSSLSPVTSYKFTGLSTFTTSISTEKFSTYRYGQVTYLNSHICCYIKSCAIKKFDTLTGIETNLIGVEQTTSNNIQWGKYNYTSPVTFADPQLGFNESYDSVTDTLFITDAPAKTVISIKNVLNGVAVIDKVIGTPNPDLNANGYVNSTTFTDQNGQVNYATNQSGTNVGRVSSVLWSYPNMVYTVPGSSFQFVMTVDVVNYLNNYYSPNVFKYFNISKVQRSRVVPFSMFNTTTPKGLTISASYSTSTVSMYVAGLTLGSITDSQRQAFTTELARVLGITPSLISLTFTAGSLIILITINNSNIITEDDNAFIVNAPAILSQLTNSDIAVIITNSGCDTSIAGTPDIDHDRTVINIDIKLRNDCRLKYKNTTIYNPIVGDDVNKCMYTLLNSKIVRINKNGRTNNICNFPEGNIRHIFITSDKTHLVIPTNIFSNDNVNDNGQTNLPYNAVHANKIYVINISTGTIYINTTQIEFLIGVGFNQFNNSVYYPSAETATYAKNFKSTIVFSNNIINSTLTHFPNRISNTIVFSDVNTGYTISSNSIVKVDLLNNNFTVIAGGRSDLTYRRLGTWDNVTTNVPQSIRNWTNIGGSVYDPFADSSNGATAWFCFIGYSNLVLDTANNRLLVSDIYSQRIRAIDLSNNYAVTTLAGTSPVFYGRAINNNGSTYTTQELSSMGQVGVWDNPITGMPKFNKVNSTYLTSTFNQPENIALFNNTFLVLDRTGTRLLSKGRVSDFTVLIQ